MNYGVRANGRTERLAAVAGHPNLKVQSFIFPRPIEGRKNFLASLDSYRIAWLKIQRIYGRLLRSPSVHVRIDISTTPALDPIKEHNQNAGTNFR